MSDYEPNIVLEYPEITMDAFFRELELPGYYSDNLESYRKKIDNLFELNKEFFSADSGGGSAGTNDAQYSMGLAICRKIFELHGYRGYSIYKDGKVTFIIEGI